MNAVAVIYVNEHLEELRAEAQRKRLVASLAPEAQPPRAASPPPPPASTDASVPTRSARLSRTSPIGRTGSDLPRTRSSLRDTTTSVPPAEVFVCLRQVGRRVDIAQRDGVGIERSPGRLGDDVRGQDLGQRAQSPFPVRVEALGGGGRGFAAQDRSAAAGRARRVRGRRRRRPGLRAPRASTR